MRVKVINLDGMALNWAVGLAERRQLRLGIGGGIEARAQGENGETLPPHWDLWYPWGPSTNWHQGGPILEDAMRVSGGALVVQDETETLYDVEHPRFSAVYMFPRSEKYYGRTPLIAAMRAFVAREWGKDVEIPDELL